MSAEVSERTTRGGIRALDWRAVLVVVAAAAVVAELPAWVRAPLSIAAAVGAVSFCIPRRRSREPIDAALNAVGGVAIALVILGLLLNLLPTGLSAPAWGVGVGVLELAMMLVSVLRDTSETPRRSLSRLVRDAGPRRLLIGAGWGVLVAGVLTGALLLSLDSYARTHIDPIALGTTTSDGTTVVTVSSGRAAGPLELRLVTEDGPDRVLADDIMVGPGEPTTTVRIASSSEGTLQLVSPTGSRVLRSLDLTGSSGKGDG